MSKSLDDQILLIAEAGVNHNGKIELARRLVDVAAEAGADYIKFQTFKADRLVSKEALKASYQEINTSGGDETQFSMLEKLEIDEEFHKEIMAYCEDKGIGFMSSAFDSQGLKMLFRLGLKVFKVPSGEITNLPYLKTLAGFGCPIILSTGMATNEEIQNALAILEKEGASHSNVTVLHCNTDYPTRFEDVNLTAMNSIKKNFGVEVGYSDHTVGIEVPIAAAALGARVIEKHFTLDRGMEGPDHKASLEPEELKAMVQSVRNIERALGSGIKEPSESELKNREVVRKSIHLATDKSMGELLTKDDLIMLRPGDGISPMKIEEVVGRELSKSLKKGHKLEYSDLNQIR
ncbi:MAG: N-acetylneuraminate synthase [Pseudomonadota bacterium]|nr:N-acetylneuraminate synthase [Pseudomonadota bacterium]